MYETITYFKLYKCKTKDVIKPILNLRSDLSSAR